jgi:hypothetical protein
MPLTLPIDSLDLPPEVLTFAAEQGVAAYLPAVVQMTRQLFPHSPLTVQIEDDPEIANDRHIVLIAENVDLEVSEAVEARWQWLRELFARCPAPLVCVFRLGMGGIR